MIGVHVAVYDCALDFAFLSLSPLCTHRRGRAVTDIDRRKSLVPNGFTSSDAPPQLMTGARLVIIDLGACEFVDRRRAPLSAAGGTLMYLWESWVGRSAQWKSRAQVASPRGGLARDCFAAGIVMLDILRGHSVESLEITTDAMKAAFGKLVDAAFTRVGGQDHISVASIFRYHGECLAAYFSSTCRAVAWRCARGYSPSYVAVHACCSDFTSASSSAAAGWAWPESFITANTTLQKYLDENSSIYDMLDSMTRMRSTGDDDAGVEPIAMKAALAVLDGDALGCHSKRRKF